MSTTEAYDYFEEFASAEDLKQIKIMLDRLTDKKESEAQDV